VAVPLSDEWAHRNLVVCVKRQQPLTAAARQHLGNATTNSMAESTNFDA
jgi:hypothetical protein